MQQPEHDLRKLSVIESQQIEDEHMRLKHFLQDLRETCCKFDGLEDCAGCDREKIASCQGRLFSFEQDFLDLVVTHFENEEKIMAAISLAEDTNEHFRLHQKEHAKLLQEMQTLMQKVLVMSRQGYTATAIREFHSKVAESFFEHVRTFDAHLTHQPKSGKS